MSDLDGYVFDEDVDDGQPLDPRDTLADPDRRQRVATLQNEYERRERNADGALSDFGSSALARRWSRHEGDE